MSDCQRYIDFYICGYLEKEVKPFAKMFCHNYKLKSNQNQILKFSDISRRILEIYRYPTGYTHTIDKQMKIYIAGYIGIWGIVFYWKCLKNLKNLEFAWSIFWGILSSPFLISSNYALKRIRDVSSIHLMDGKILLIQTFQDGPKVFKYDLSDLRIVNNDLNEFIIMVDRFSLLKMLPMFYFIRPLPKCINNQLIFEKVIIDQYYLRYKF